MGKFSVASAAAVLCAQDVNRGAFAISIRNLFRTATSTKKLDDYKEWDEVFPLYEKDAAVAHLDKVAGLWGEYTEKLDLVKLSGIVRDIVQSSEVGEDLLYNQAAVGFVEKVNKFKSYGCPMVLKETRWDAMKFLGPAFASKKKRRMAARARRSATSSEPPSVFSLLDDKADEKASVDHLNTQLTYLRSFKDSENNQQMRAGGAGLVGLTSVISLASAGVIGSAALAGTALVAPIVVPTAGVLLPAMILAINKQNRGTCKKLRLDIIKVIKRLQKEVVIIRPAAGSHGANCSGRRTNVHFDVSYSTRKQKSRFAKAQSGEEDKVSHLRGTVTVGDAGDITEISAIEMQNGAPVSSSILQSSMYLRMTRDSLCGAGGSENVEVFLKPGDVVSTTVWDQVLAESYLKFSESLPHADTEWNFSKWYYEQASLAPTAGSSGAGIVEQTEEDWIEQDVNWFFQAVRDGTCFREGSDWVYKFESSSEPVTLWSGADLPTKQEYAEEIRRQHNLLAEEVESLED